IKIRINPPDKFSFPSGHTAGAFVMATMISVFYPAWTIPGYTMASVIGVSRVYNGVHFPTDVMAGVLLGRVCAMLGLWIS
ncbi:phosphatase PAP2 family protein, partial [candidate division KSB1 bacterium]|nr:phosphatase PAP2 family protein [candidate division KSB1 bacterium]